MTDNQPVGRRHPDAGDLGRRITRRREELGLSREDLAARARVAATFIRYVEQAPANVTIDSVRRLARALNTSAEALLGGGVDYPAGRGTASPDARLIRLGRAECLRLIAPGGVGRVAYQAVTGPVVVPVNFAVVDGSIVLRTTAHGTLTELAGTGAPVGFEVDHLDDALREGWSVLVHGRLRQLNGPERDLVVSMVARPWAGGVRDTYLSIDVGLVTGRRIHAG